ncbi:MAG: DUF3575 domain-containing protein [Chitinophagaceae bacterium]|nr:DUF3575 domain-containing protein [Chitinophagaceae bacterium]
MKQLLFSVLASCCLSSAMANPNGEMPEKLNCIKINPTSLLFRTMNVQYERVLHPHVTVALQARYTIPKIYNGSFLAPDNTSYTELKLSSLCITPEFRYYVNEAMRGFYVAPYLRYRTINLDFNFPIPYNGAISKGLFDGGLSSYGGGLMIGVHKPLGNNFSMDFFIVGLQYMHNRAKITGDYNLNLSAAEQQDLLNSINDDIKEVKRFVKDLTTSVGPNSTKVSGNFNSLGFRGFGINFGYRF